STISGEDIRRVRQTRQSRLAALDYSGLISNQIARAGRGMITVGTFEAKTRLSALLERVAAGEEVVITKHGKPIARLVSAGATDRAKVDAVIARLKELRKGTTLGGLSWKELRDEGRR